MANLLLFFSGLVLLMCCGVSYAALTPTQYWKTALPNTPMPESIRHILSPPEEMSTSATFSGPNPFITWDDNPFRIWDDNPFITWDDVAIATRYQDTLSRAIFKEDDLFPGANFTMQFKRSVTNVNLLPRRVANIIPFSSAKLPKILSLFSIDPKSKEAQEMSDILEHCERPGMKGETKYCATSLESMIDFTISSLGTNNVKAMSTVLSKIDSSTPPYTVNSFEKIFDKTRSVICHPTAYAYVVFHCHNLGNSERGYVVSLTGKDGTQVQATAMCHTDTSDWNPDHLAFHLLNIKPGKTNSICHLLPLGDVLWFPNEQSF